MVMATQPEFGDGYAWASVERVWREVVGVGSGKRVDFEGTLKCGHVLAAALCQPGVAFETRNVRAHMVIADTGGRGVLGGDVGGLSRINYQTGAFRLEFRRPPARPVASASSLEILALLRF